MKIFYLVTLLATTLFINPVLGQESVICNDRIFEDTLLGKITGNWSVTGKIGGNNITYQFEAGWELNHQFMVLTFSDTAKQPQYTAKVFIGYDCVRGRYVAHWLDNFGGRFSETLGYGTRTGDSIQFRFEYPEGPFINKLVYDRKANTWQFHTTTKNSKGVWVTFGDMFLKRK